MTSEKLIKEITYRFVIRTADGAKNFLSVLEKPNGDIHILERGKHSFYDLPADVLANGLGASKEDRVSRIITVHPSLSWDDNRITVNYKTRTNGIETERVQIPVLDVKDGLMFFPVIGSIGSNIGTTNFDFPSDKKVRDVRVLLWPNQKFDWTLQSVGYAFFIGNAKINYVFPANFPHVVQILRFAYFQLLFVYWVVDRPTVGTGLYAVPEAPEGIPSGMEFDGVVSFIQALNKKYLDQYDSFPDFLPDQLPDHLVAHQGIPVIDPRIYFKRPAFQILADRDASVMRITFTDISGARLVVDLNGKSITEFRDTVNAAIQAVPGLAEWGGELEPLDVLADRQRSSDPPPA